MFAIAWKEYRQIRLVGVLLLAVLVLAYVASWASPWAQYRWGVLFAGPVIIVSLIGVLAFAQERHDRTDRFLAALPLGGVKRWVGKTSANFVFTCAGVGILLLAIFLIDGESRSALLGEAAFPHLPWSVFGFGVLLPLWAASLFYSALFERPATALVWGLMTLVAGFILALRLKDGIDLSCGGELFRLEFVIPALLATPTIVFLSGSFIVEAKRKAGLRGSTKAFAVITVPIACLLAAVLVMSLGVVHIWETDNRGMAEHRGRFIWSIDTPPAGDGVFVQRDDRRLLRTDLAGAWRLYEAENMEIPRWRMPRWPISPEGGVLAYFERTRKSFGEVSRQVVQRWWADRNSWLTVEKYHPRFLDLDSGEVIVPDLPSDVNVLSTFLGWHGEPPRLFVLVDRYERGVDAFLHESNSGLLESEIYVLSREGTVVERRDVAEMTAFRKKTRVPGREGGFNWCPVGSPKVAGNTVVIPYDRVDQRSLHVRRRYGDDLRPTMVCDVLTGECRQRRTADPKRHVAFSGDLEWEILIDRLVPPEWDANDSYRYETARGSVNLNFDPQSDSETPSDRPPGLIVEGREGAAVQICAFPPDLRSVRANYAFLLNANALFILVTETSAEPTPGFEQVVWERPGGGRIEVFTNRRVRAIAIDLETGDRSEEILSPAIVDLLVDPEASTIICHSSIRLPYAPDGWLNWDCHILSLPPLATQAVYHWPEGDGPPFTPGGWNTRFVGSGKTATVRWGPGRGISVWNIGPESAQIIDMPDLQGE